MQGPAYGLQPQTSYQQAPQVMPQVMPHWNGVSAPVVSTVSISSVQATRAPFAMPPTFSASRPAAVGFGQPPPAAPYLQPPQPSQWGGVAPTLSTYTGAVAPASQMAPGPRPGTTEWGSMQLSDESRRAAQQRLAASQVTFPCDSLPVGFHSRAVSCRTCIYADKCVVFSGESAGICWGCFYQRGEC